MSGAIKISPRCRSAVFFVLLIGALSTAYTQEVVEVPAIRIEDSGQQTSPPEVYRFGDRLSPSERHSLPELTPEEQDRMLEPQGFEVIGVVRDLPVPLFLNNLTPELLSPEGEVVGGGLLMLADDGKAVWTTYVHSSQANALRILLATGYLPPGCEVYIYNDGGEAYGPYSFGGAIPEGGFWSNTIFGDHVYIEVHISEASLELIELVELEIYQIVHVEHPSFQLDPHSTCFEDVTCSYAQAFSGIESLTSATARITFTEGGVAGVCSGGLLNDGRWSPQPFFLTEPILKGEYKK